MATKKKAPSTNRPANLAKAKAPKPDLAPWWERLDAAWKELVADQCGVASAAQAKKIHAVKELYIDDASKVTSLAPLAAFEKLEELDCDAKGVTDLGPLAKLPRLRALRISSPRVESLVPLAELAALRRVDVSKTAVTDVGPLAGLRKLEQLDVEDTKVADLSPLAGLKNLETLTIAGTKVTDLSPLAGSKKLQGLDLSRTSVAAFDVLAKLRGLTTFRASETALASLRPLHGAEGIHILSCERTRVPFEEVLRYFALARSRGDSFIGLDLYSDFSPNGRLTVDAVAGIDFALDGLEDALTAWVNDSLLSRLKSESAKAEAPAFLRAYLRLPIAGQPSKYREELAGNALHLIVSQDVGAELERQVLDVLLPAEVTDRRLAFNLACFHARRGHKPEVLAYAKLSLSKGQEAAKFQLDPDFAAFQSDPDFAELVATPQMPSADVDPLGWWTSLPKDLRDGLEPEEETEEAIRALLARDDVEVQLSAPKGLDGLRGLRCVRELVLYECMAHTAEAVGTLENLELLHWEKDPYLRGTQLVDVSPLAACTKLRDLRLAGHAIADLGPLAGLRALQELQLRRNPVRSLEPLRGLVELRNLSVEVAVPVDTAPLAGLAKLEQLWLHGPVRSLDGLRGLRSLRRLWIQNAVAADGGALSFEPLYGLSSLKKVWIDDARRPALEKELAARLPGCEVA